MGTKCRTWPQILPYPVSGTTAYHFGGIVPSVLPLDLRCMQPWWKIRVRTWRTIAMGFVLMPHISTKGQDLEEARRLIRTGAADQAIALLEPLAAHHEREKDTLDLVRTLALLGRARYDAGDLPAALKDLQRTIDLGGVIQAWSELGRACSLKAIIARETSPPDSSKRLYERAIAYHLLAGDTSACAIVYDNMGEFNLLSGDIPGAIAWSEKALGCLKDTTWPEYHRTAAVVESSLSNYYTWLGERERGIAHGVRSVDLARRSGEVFAIVHTGTQLAGAYLAAGEPRKALPLLLRSDSLARTHAVPLNKHRDIPELLSTTYELLGDHALALRYYKERSVLNDSVHSSATRRAMERLERRQLQVTDSLRYDGVLREQAARHDAAISAQRWFTGSAVAVGALVLLAALLYRDRNRRLQLANATILEQQERLVESEKARQAEELRTRIARDIHDEIGGELTKITLLGKKARRQMDEGSREASEALDRIRDLSRRVGASLSDIVWAVDPERDTVQGLVDHARIMVTTLLEDVPFQVEMRFVHTGPDRSIDATVRRDIFMVLKEALNNTLKHARASHVQVLLETDALAYVLRVKDDGQGFSDGAARGNGSKNIRARVERLHARFEITSAPGSGTSIELRGCFR